MEEAPEKGMKKSIWLMAQMAYLDLDQTGQINTFGS